MKDDRLRVPIDAPYLHSVGLAVICFSRLEWDAVWCCEKINPGYIHTVAKKTAGQIADDLIQLSTNHADQAVSGQMSPAANEFKRLTKRRNDFLNANPATAPNGDQRLFRDGVECDVTPNLHPFAIRVPASLLRESAGEARGCVA